MQNISLTEEEKEQLTELHRMKYIDLYYCDESHFGLTPNVGYAWQQKDNPIFYLLQKVDD